MVKVIWLFNRQIKLHVISLYYMWEVIFPLRSYFKMVVLACLSNCLTFLLVIKKSEIVLGFLNNSFDLCYGFKYVCVCPTCGSARQLGTQLSSFCELTKVHNWGNNRTENQQANVRTNKTNKEWTIEWTDEWKKLDRIRSFYATMEPSRRVAEKTVTESSRIKKG